MEFFEYVIVTLLFVVAAFSVFNLIFGLVTYFKGYAPTLSSSDEVLKNLKKIYQFKNNQQLADLGSGTGKVLNYLKKKPKSLTGYEINPLIYPILKLRFANNKKIRIKKKDFLDDDLSQYDVLFIYGIEQVMDKLERKLAAEEISNLDILSNKFTFKNLKPYKQEGEVYWYRL